MPIQIQCPNEECGKRLQCPDEHAGKTVKCPACGAQIQVPEAGGKEMLGDYQLVRKLGQGGMGAVYEATQVRLQRQVALKVLPNELTVDPAFLERFYREARAAAALNHPNIIQVHDIAEDRGTHFFSMEYVDGESLQDRLKREDKLPTRDALEIVESVAKALRYAHRHSIIHRDIKPDNVMLSAEGHVKLADLGLAKKLEDDRSVTQTGAGMGTPYYMAPEQAESAKDVDHRADIYALGITLLHLLTGKRPFEGDSGYAIAIAHATKELPTGEALGTRLPRGVEAVIRKMCAKDPAERYQDYEALLQDLENAKAGKPTQAAMAGVTARPEEAPVPASDAKSGAAASAASTVPASKRASRKRAGKAEAKEKPAANPLLYAAGGAAAVVVLGVVAFLVLRPGETTKPEDKVVSAKSKEARTAEDAVEKGKGTTPTERTTTSVRPVPTEDDKAGARTRPATGSLPGAEERDAERDELASRAEELLGKEPEELTEGELQSLRGLKTLLGDAWERTETAGPSIRWHGMYGIGDDVYRECATWTNASFGMPVNCLSEALDAGKKVVIWTKFNTKDPRQWDSHLTAIRNALRGREDLLLGLYLPDEAYRDNKLTPKSLAALAATCRTVFPDTKLFVNFGWPALLEGKSIPGDIDYPMFEIYPFTSDFPRDDLKALEAKVLPQIQALRHAATGRPLFLWLQAYECAAYKMRASSAKEAAHLLDLVSRQPDVVGVSWFKWASQKDRTGISGQPGVRAVITKFGTEMLNRLAMANKHLEAGRGAKEESSMERAIAELHRAEALDGLNPHVHWALAATHAALNDRDEAATHLRQFLCLERAGGRAKAARDALTRLTEEGAPAIEIAKQLALEGKPETPAGLSGAEKKQLALRAPELLGKAAEELTAEDFEALNELRMLLGRAWSASELRQPSLRWHGMGGELDGVLRDTGTWINLVDVADRQGLERAVKAKKKVIFEFEGLDPKRPDKWDAFIDTVAHQIKGREEHILGLFVADNAYANELFTPSSMDALTRKCRARFPQMKLTANFGWAEVLEGKSIPDEIDYPTMSIWPFWEGVRVDDLREVERRALKNIHASRRIAKGRPLLVILQAVAGNGPRAPTARETRHLVSIVARQPDIIGASWHRWDSSHHKRSMAQLPEMQPVAAELGRSILKARSSAEKHLRAGAAAKAAGDLRTALSELQQAEELDRLSADVHWELGRTFALLGKQADAVRHFQQFVRLERTGERTREARAFLASPAAGITEYAEAWEQERAARKDTEAFGRLWGQLEARIKRREFDKVGDVLNAHRDAVDEPTRTRLLADAEMLRLFFKHAELNLGQLKGRTIRVGGIGMKVADTRDGRIYVKQGGAEMAWPLERLDLGALEPLGRSAAKGPKDLARQKMLLAVFFGDDKGAARAISEAKDAGVDVSIYEARLGGTAPAGGMAPGEPASPTIASTFEIPRTPKDKLGNPIRKGKDKTTGLPLEIRHRETGMHLAFIPPGSFKRGTAEKKFTATITRPFYIGKYEVTQEQYEAVTGENPSKYRHARNLPADSVSWDAAVGFCRKLSGKGKGTFRLPTDAEWEYACRARTEAACYFEGRDWDAHAWSALNAGKQTHPVGQKEPNPWGLYDIYGNVFEWCSDWFGDYPNQDVENPTGPAEGTVHVTRGGGIGRGVNYCTSHYRTSLPSRGVSPENGFRVAWSPR